MNSITTRRVIPWVVIFLIGVLVGRLITPTPHPEHGDHAGQGQAVAASEPAGAASIWTCSMHPQIQLPKAGKCPICFMDLIPLPRDEAGDEGPRELRMSRAAMALAEIETTEVRRGDATVRVDMVGKIDVDTTRIHDIVLLSDAELRNLFVNVEGVLVKKGDHLAEFYSPDVYAAGQDYLVTLQSRGDDSGLVASAQKKLQLLGTPAAYIESISKNRIVPETFTLLSRSDGFVEGVKGYRGMWIKKGMLFARVFDTSVVWAYLNAYESDLAWIRYGQTVSLRAEALPGTVFAGVIAYIPPRLDEATRSIKVRVNVDNPGFRLKPGMFVSATVEAAVSSVGSVMSPNLRGKWISPMHPEIVKDGPGFCDVCGMDLVPVEELGYGPSSTSSLPLLIPVSAALITGKRAVVYVRQPGEEPVFEGREIELGPRAGHQWVVFSGLREGERVVSKGNFKIDSSLQIQAKPSMMSVDGGDSPLKTPAQEPTAIDSPALRESMTGFLDSYLELHQKLTRDDFEGVPGLAAHLQAELKKFDDTGLKGRARESWKEALKKLEQSMEHLHHYRDIKSFRAAFMKVSESVISLLERVGHARAPLHVMHCAMAKGSWIQADKTLLNPYYGQSMLRCGDVVSEIPSSPTVESK